MIRGNLERQVGRVRQCKREVFLAKVAIAHPFEIWAAGLEAILVRNGWTVSGHWTSLEQIAEENGFSQTDLLVLANRFWPRARNHARARPLEGRFDGKIILVLDPDDRFYVDDFLGLDVEGLLLSSAVRDDVENCIAAVERGQRWVDSGLAGLLLGHGHSHVPDWGQLSSREMEIAKLASSGLSNKDIAKMLGVSDGTIKMHMHHILAKLHLTSRSDISRFLNERALAS